MTNKKNLFNWLLLLLLLTGSSMTFVACSSPEDTPETTPAIQTPRFYAPEVYLYLNKANERENLDEAGSKGYAAHEWRMEVKNKAVTMPDNFRWSEGEFTNTGTDSELPDSTYVPSRQGLENLHISGSGRFSEKQLQALTDFINEKAGNRQKVLIDLRSECHGFVNGHHLSWYGYIN